MKKVLALLFVVLLMIGLVACGGGGSDEDHEIVGRWVFEGDPSWVTTFNADGTGTHAIDWGFGTSFEWSIRGGGGILRWNYSGHPSMDTSISLSGDVLDITMADGTVFRYLRD